MKLHVDACADRSSWTDRCRAGRLTQIRSGAHSAFSWCVRAPFVVCFVSCAVCCVICVLCFRSIPLKKSAMLVAELVSVSGSHARLCIAVPTARADPNELVQFVRRLGRAG